MSDYPPYMNAYGSISKVLNKMIEAKRPDRFTQDFLDTVLALPSSSLRPIIPLLKRIGFLNSDGSPTDLRICKEFVLKSRAGSADARRADAM